MISSRSFLQELVDEYYEVLVDGFVAAESKVSEGGTALGARPRPARPRARLCWEEVAPQPLSARTRMIPLGYKKLVLAPIASTRSSRSRRESEGTAGAHTCTSTA